MENIENKQLREILAETKRRASNNLKFRIMQQIESEKILSQRKSKDSFSIFKSMLSIFGTMYTVILLVGLYIYTMWGKEAIESWSTFMIIILIASICSLFWMISTFDERRRMGNKK